MGRGAYHGGGRGARRRRPRKRKTRPEKTPEEQRRSDERRRRRRRRRRRAARKLLAEYIRLRATTDAGAVEFRERVWPDVVAHAPELVDDPRLQRAHSVVTQSGCLFRPKVWCCCITAPRTCAHCGRRKQVCEARFAARWKSVWETPPVLPTYALLSRECPADVCRHIASFLPHPSTLHRV